ncbi:MAG: hypothetical protein RMY29_007280 [Nostoc sp. CreGUA01]|nr:hypothetical protein [Nostoc sp. CreGUA01]
MGRWGDEGDEGDEGDGEVGRWGKGNSSFPLSPHPLIPPSSSHAPCPNFTIPVQKPRYHAI